MKPASVFSFIILLVLLCPMLLMAVEMQMLSPDIGIPISSHCDNTELCDLDNNGKYEYILSTSIGFNPKVLCWEQDAVSSMSFSVRDGLFSYQTMDLVWHTALALMDLGNDGIADLIICDYDGLEPLPKHWSADIEGGSAFSGLPEHEDFCIGFQYDTDNLWYPTSCDLDNDGNMELIIIDSFENAFHLEQFDSPTGFGNFFRAYDHNGDISNVWSMQLPISSVPYCFDWDNDGLMDLFISHGAITRYEQSAPGSFQFDLVNESFCNAEYAWDIAFADLDNDGYMDMLVTGTYGPVQRWEVTPEVSTGEVLNTALEGTVTFQVDVVDNDALTFSEVGVCWSTSPDPGMDDNLVVIGAGSGHFELDVSGFTTYESYYVRSYAIDQYGTSFGETQSFHIDAQEMELLSIETALVNSPVLPGNTNQPIIRLDITTVNSIPVISVREIWASVYNYIGEDVDCYRMWYTGLSDEFSTDIQFGQDFTTPENMDFIAYGSIYLEPGVNHFWLSADVSSDAPPGNVIDAGFFTVTICDNINNQVETPDNFYNPPGNNLICEFDQVPGYALEFDGVDDMLEIDSPSLIIDNEFTIAAWIRPDNLSNRQGVFSTRTTNQPGGIQLEVGYGNGGVNKVAVAGKNTWVAVSEDNVIQPGEWNHVACSRSGSSAGETKLYVNGVEVALTTENDYNVVTNSDPIRVASGTNGVQLYQGEIDELQFWGRALNETEIREIVHRSYRVYLEDLEARWQFNEGAGSTVRDLTGRHTASLVNMTDDDWLASTIPFSSGFVYSTVEQDGIVSFGNCNLQLDYTQQSAAHVTVSMLDFPPNQYPEVTAFSGEVLGTKYWVLQRDGDSGFTGNMIFTVNDNFDEPVTPEEQCFKLFHRPVNSDGEWYLLRTATWANSGDNTICFASISQTGQFLVAYAPLPEPVALQPVRSDSNAMLGGMFRFEFPSQMHAGTGNFEVYNTQTELLHASVPAGTAVFSGSIVELDTYVPFLPNTSYRVEAGADVLYDALDGPWTGTLDQDWSFETGSISTLAGSCLAFDGVDDHVDLGHFPNLDITEGITIECWIKPDVHEDWASIILSPAGFEGKYALSLGDSEGSIGACYSVDGGVNINRKSMYPAIQMNEWTHVAFTANASGQAKIFINGIAAMCATQASFDFTGDDLWIGAKQDGSGHFQGTIDELRIWDHPRTQQQIAENMCIPIDTQIQGLKCYLQMNEGNGIITRDIACGNDGALSGTSRSGWQASTVPYGTGQYEPAVINSVGQYTFTQTDLDLSVISFSPVEEDTLFVYCNLLQTQPNILPQSVDSVFDNQYWVIQNSSGVQFETEATFYIAEDVSAYDEANPATLALYRRGLGSESDWVFLSRAISASSSGNSVTFTGLTDMSQFIIARNTNFPSPEGVPGYCLSFDGVNEYLTLDTEQAYDFNDQFTVECWFKPTSDESFYISSLISKDWEIVLSQDPGILYFTFMADFCDYVIYQTFEDIWTNHWNHLAVSYTYSQSTYTGTVALYLNGELVASGEGWDTVPNSQVPVRIGTGGSLNENCFDGSIDQVRFWSVCRTQQEIREHMYNPVLGIEPGLIGVFQFNEASGLSVTDIINGLQGTMTNMDNGNWMTSTIPFGSGTSFSGIESQAITDFHETDISMEFIQNHGAEITATKIDIASNLQPVEPDQVLTPPYWVINRFGSGEFGANITFTLSDLNEADSNNPERISLFTRASNSDDIWVNLTCASAVDTGSMTATFDSIGVVGQFIIARWYLSIDPPQNLMINVIGANVEISWDETPTANSYRVFAGDSINGTFVDVTDSGTFGQDNAYLCSRDGTLHHSNRHTKSSDSIQRSRTTWSMSISEDTMFFYVTSSTVPED